MGEEKKHKRGRRSERQTKVLAMVGSRPFEGEAKKGKSNRKAGYLKMKAMEDFKADSINQAIGKGVNAGTTAQTDGTISLKNC